MVHRTDLSLWMACHRLFSFLKAVLNPFLGLEKANPLMVPLSSWKTDGAFAKLLVSLLQVVAKERHE